jgi:hypothetical protein
MASDLQSENGKIAELPKLEAVSGSASVHTERNLLIVSTGAVERRWKWTGSGFATVELRDLSSRREWTDVNRQVANCDWSNPEVIPTGAQAEVVALTACEDDDEGFTSKHLEVAAEIAYPQAGVSVRYVIWAYPGATGLRTQLWVKGGAAGEDRGKVEEKAAIQSTNGRRVSIGSMASTLDGKYSFMQYAEKELVFRISGLKRDKNYTLGLTWWDVDEQGRRQHAVLESVDRETVVEAIPAMPLPAWKEGDSLPPETLTCPIPDGVRPDGTATLRVKTMGEQTANVVVCEVWVEESNGQGEAERVAYWAAATLNSEASQAGNGSTEPTRSVDFIPVFTANRQVQAIGYYNDTQNRNKPGTPVLRDEPVETGGASSTVDWASILCIEESGSGLGLALVKESHKCVNQPGVDTGAFTLDEHGLYNTGWGLSAAELDPDRYQWCWASWTIVYEGGALGRELAIKEFDRLRYPVQPERDMWSVVCTWGHCLNPRDGRNYAQETEVLKEMEIVADLGMDMLLIDDGWQVSRESASWNPDGGIGWKPHPQNYPEGWDRVVAAKERLGLRLGLWGVAQHTQPEDMVWNFNRLGMEQFKLDFAALKSHSALDELMRKVRRFMLETGQHCIISWDTTENAARYGYYWAREYGNVHFMNRKPVKPISVVYVPWLALRDFWQLAKYQNLNKWQLVIQNPEVIDREHSDAWRHSVSYCIATAFMGVPEFMAVPRYYSEAARNEIRPLMALYKEHQRELFDSFVFPIGDEPSGASWTGFQAWHPDKRRGYLTLFRERLNGNKTAEIALKFVPPGTTLTLTNLRNNEVHQATADEGGRILFHLNQSGDFMFVKYELQ